MTMPMPRRLPGKGRCTLRKCTLLHTFISVIVIMNQQVVGFRVTVRGCARIPITDSILSAAVGKETNEDDSAVTGDVGNESRTANGSRSRKNVFRESSNVIGDSVEEEQNGGAPASTKKRRRRRKDFPSFAYRPTKYPNSKRENLRVRFQSSCTDSTQEEIYNTRTSRVVSVPKFEEKDKDSFLKKLFLTAVGPTLEATGIFDTERALPTAKQTRLLTDRAYARQEPFAAENITVPPSLDDLAARSREPFEGFWISAPARVSSFALSYFSFPYITKVLEQLVTMAPEQLDAITSKFAPGISILYGTFISLTLSILYNRMRDIQDNVAIECALLTTITRTLLSLFRDYREEAIEAGQCVADQVRTLVRTSRGAELMLLMYSDPYARMLELVDYHEEELFRTKGGAGSSASRFTHARDVLKDLCKVRANRLSDESLALPPTHFQILNILTGLILVGYTVSILPTVPRTGEPLDESCLLFAALSSIYVLFYNFASDLNNPFRGVYQLRRSCAASHLLEIKWLIANHPCLRGEVDFEEVDEDLPGVQIRSPGLGDFWFERDEFYVDDQERTLS